MSNVGTEYKINVKMEPMGEIHLSNCEFEAQFYTNPTKGQTITKSEMKEIDSDNYLALVDSERTGAGELMMRIAIDLPDADFNDGARREVHVIKTGVKIDR